MTASTNPFLRGWWRKIGLVALLVSAALAIIAVPTRILHDTVVHAVRISGRDVPDGVVFSASAPVCAAYWSVWIFSLFVALVMALIDVRHIRREFGLERAALLRESLGDDLASSSLQKNRKP